MFAGRKGNVRSIYGSVGIKAHDRGAYVYAIEEYGFRYLRNDTVHAREPGSRWMHHAEMDRAPLWQPETRVAQSSNAARIQTIPQFASVASLLHRRMCSLGLFITDLFTRLTRDLRITILPFGSRARTR